MDSSKNNVFFYTLLHLLVDFATIFLVTGILLGPKGTIANRGYIIILYNLVAFAGQLPIGMVADVVQKNHLFVSLGCLLAALSYPVALLSPWVACILAALGNAFFHIGAGTEVLKKDMPKAGLSGLFVSSGAMGVWLAYRASEAIITWLSPILMLLFSAICLFMGKTSAVKVAKEPVTYQKPTFGVLLSIGLFMFTIMIRSLLGMIMNFPWKAAPLLSFAAVLAVVLSKALGGFLGDRFGYKKTATLSLSLSFLAFIFGFNTPIAGIIAVLCFNMTMPLTLTAIAGLSHKKYGFAFGMTTFALAIGFLPVPFGAAKWFTTPFLLAGVALSLLCMLLGYYLMKKVGKNHVDSGNSSL